MTAPERFADSQIPLAPRAPSIHGTFQTRHAWLTKSVLEGKADLPVEHPDF